MSTCNPDPVFRSEMRGENPHWAEYSRAHFRNLQVSQLRTAPQRSTLPGTLLEYAPRWAEIQTRPGVGMDSEVAPVKQSTFERNVSRFRL